MLIDQTAERPSRKITMSWKLSKPAELLSLDRIGSKLLISAIENMFIIFTLKKDITTFHNPHIYLSSHLSYIQFDLKRFCVYILSNVLFKQQFVYNIFSLSYLIF